MTINSILRALSKRTWDEVLVPLLVAGIEAYALIPAAQIEADSNNQEEKDEVRRKGNRSR